MTNTPRRVILAIDIGSSSVRCSAYSRHNNDDTDAVHVSSMIASTQKQLRGVEPSTGQILVSKIQTQVDTCVDDVLNQLQRGALDDDTSSSFEIVSIGISTFVMNLIGLDNDNNVVTTLSYACNTPSVAAESRALLHYQSCDDDVDDDDKKKRVDYEALRQRTGCYSYHSSYALPQLRCYYRDQPTTTPSVRRWTTIASLILSSWIDDDNNKACTGKEEAERMLNTISYSEASWTGMLNFRTGTWDEELISQYLPEDARCHLPTICKDNVLTTGMAPMIRQWPQMARAILLAGVGDGVCANVGSKCTSSNRIAVTIGTSAASRIILPIEIGDETFHVPKGLWCYRIDGKRVLLGGALTDGGSVVEWARALLNLKEDRDFETCLSQIHEQIVSDPYHCNDSCSVTTVPFLSGERSIGWRDGAKGCVHGLTRDVTSVDFMRSCLEGLMLRLAAVLKILVLYATQNGGGDDEDDIFILVSGTALERNETLRKMLANFCLGSKIVVDMEGARESTSRGIALLATAAQWTDKSSSLQSYFWPNEEEIIISKEDYTALTAETESALKQMEKGQNDLIESVCVLW